MAIKESVFPNITILSPYKVKNIKENTKESEIVVFFDEKNICLSFRFVSRDVINISYYKDRLVKNKYVDVYEENYEKGFKVKFLDCDNKFSFSNGYLCIFIYKNPFFYEIRRDDEIIFSQAIDDRDIVGNRYSDLFKFTLKDNQIESIKDSFLMGSYEKLYGFGEKFTPINKRGRHIEAWNYDAFGVCSDKSYKNIPFFLNSKGYGIFIRTTSKIKYDLGNISFDSFSIDVEDVAFDYYFIYGPLIKDIISKYIILTGKVEDVPPKWSFGLWMSKYGYKSRDEVEKVSKKLRDRNIPTDVICLDPFWLRDGHYCDFVFDEFKFPNPKEMISSMKEKGFRLRFWIQPTVSIKTEMFKEGEKHEYFLKDKKGNVYLWQCPLPREPEGLESVDFSKIDMNKLGIQPKAGIVDFTNPSAVFWYLSKLKYLIDWGAGIIMCDFGEEIPDDTYFYNGKTGKEMHNVYSYLYSGSVYRFIKKTRSEKPICEIRSGWAGMQKYPICWAGDPKENFDAMREVLRGGLSLALSGVIFWSHDIGGSAGGSSLRSSVDPDLYIRWAQFGMFTSHARCHGGRPKEPWNFGEKAEDVFRRYDKLRYSLIPYIYSCAYECVKYNIPFIKPLVFDYQEDPIDQDIDDEYIFGNSFLVAPVFDRNNYRYIYFPEGTWIDYWTKKIYEGYKNYKYEATLDTLPLFVKSGSIIPMQEDVDYIINQKLDKLILDIYPSDYSNFKYKDDYEEIIIECFSDKNSIGINISNMSKDYKLVINDFKDRIVKVNGMIIDKYVFRNKDKAIINLERNGK